MVGTLRVGGRRPRGGVDVDLDRGGAGGEQRSRCPPRACSASSVLVSGPSSGTSRCSHAVHPVASLTRTRTLTSCARTLLARLHDTPATVKRAAERSCVKTSGQTAAGTASGAASRAAWSTPPMGASVTVGATGRAASGAANDTVGRATKTGVRATARAAEISLIGTVQWRVGLGEVPGLSAGAGGRLPPNASISGLHGRIRTVRRTHHWSTRSHGHQRYAQQRRPPLWRRGDSAALSRSGAGVVSPWAPRAASTRRSHSSARPRSRPTSSIVDSKSAPERMNSGVDVPEHLERDGAVEPCPRPLEHPHHAGRDGPEAVGHGGRCEVGPEHGEDGRVQVLVGGDRELVRRPEPAEDLAEEAGEEVGAVVGDARREGLDSGRVNVPGRVAPSREPGAMSASDSSGSGVAKTRRNSAGLPSAQRRNAAADATICAAGSSSGYRLRATVIDATTSANTARATSTRSSA